MIEQDVLERLQAIAARTGLSKSEQIRQGIRWWLESREWPEKEELKEEQGPVRNASAVKKAVVRPGKKRRPTNA
jgi:metal-responsive CopG/Arc/MetJ family transcriptional regulator